MRFAKIVIATDAYADRVGEKFGLSFETENMDPMTMILDRPTLERLQHQIAFALKPQTPPAQQQ